MHFYTYLYIGVRITNFYGNYFIRGQDLLALPNCNSDSVYAVDLTYDEPTLSAQVITIQAALLYTSSNGERRIRVHTHVLPVTQSIPEVIESIDIDSIVNIFIKQAVDIASKTGFENARSRVHQLAVEILRGTKPQIPGFSGIPGQLSGSGPGGYGQPGQYGQQQSQQVDTPIPITLQLLPLYAMAIQKSLVLRGGTEVRTDERAFYHHLVGNMDVEDSKVFVYPRLFSLHDLSEEAGLPCTHVEGEGERDVDTVVGPFRIKLPYILNLSHERLMSDGIYLLENGYELVLWIGRSVSPSLLYSLFGVQSIEGVDMSTLELHTADNTTPTTNGDNNECSDTYLNRIHAIIVGLRQVRSRYMYMRIIREGDGPGEAYLARYLVEDR